MPLSVDGNLLPALIPTVLLQRLLVGLEWPHVLMGVRWCSPSPFVPLQSLSSSLVLRWQQGLGAGRCCSWKQALGTSPNCLQLLDLCLSPPLPARGWELPYTLLSEMLFACNMTGVHWTVNLQSAGHVRPVLLQHDREDLWQDRYSSSWQRDIQLSLHPSENQK